MLPLLLIMGVAAIVTYAATSSASSAQAPIQTWPPGPQFNGLLLQELTIYATNVNGGPLSATQQANLLAAVQNGPNEYVASLSGGTPTIPGYQVWFWNQWAQANAFGAASATASNPYLSSAVASGPLYPVFMGYDEDTQSATRMYQDIDGRMYVRGQ
jgi:hypothetical protein